MKRTKIERVETVLWDRWLLIRVYCEDGTVGIGEGGVHGWQRPTETMIKTCEPYEAAACKRQLDQPQEPASRI